MLTRSVHGHVAVAVHAHDDVNVDVCR